MGPSLLHHELLKAAELERDAPRRRRCPSPALRTLVNYLKEAAPWRKRRS